MFVNSDAPDEILLITGLSIVILFLETNISLNYKK